MNRWKIALLLPLALLLNGCVTYPTYTYRDSAPDREFRYIGGDTYYSPAADDYGDYYAGGYRYGSAGYRYYAPDYISYSAYYSLFWPLHRWYHDPYWHPGFHYGVTYFPRNYFSISFHSGWRGSSYAHWGYGGRYSIALGYSHWYSPYRHSWADSYYDWDRYAYRYRYHDERRGRVYRTPAWSAPRFGHARNQAERLAWQERSRSAPRGDGIATGLGVRAPSVYGTARAPARGADYGTRREVLPTASPRSSRTWSQPSPAASATARYRTESAPVLRGRGAELRSQPQPRSVAPQVSPRAGSAVRSYQTAPDARELAQPRQPQARSAPARAALPAREYRAEPPRSFAPEQRFEPAATAPGAFRGADRGARTFDAPSPAPRVERATPETFRSAPAEPRREMAPAPRESRGAGRSRARGALPHD